MCDSNKQVLKGAEFCPQCEKFYLCLYDVEKCSDHEDCEEVKNNNS